MNPMTNVKNIQKLNEKVLQMGVEDSTSWHKQYKDSAYVFIGGLPYDLTEGDILCVFSQYGEIVDVNLVRDKSSGKSKGYGFLCYEDQRSTILAVDNFNGIKLGGRTIRVDHVANYKRPKGDERDETGERKELPLIGCAPTTPSGTDSDEQENVVVEPKKKKKKKEKSKKRSKENKKSEKVKEEEETRANSPCSEGKSRKVHRQDKQLDDRTRKVRHSPDLDRDRKRYRDDRAREDKMNVDNYRRYKERETDRKDVKYRENINEKLMHRTEKGKDKDIERKRHEDRNRR